MKKQKEMRETILRVLKEYQFGDNLRDDSYITGILKYEFGNVADEIIERLNISDIKIQDNDIATIEVLHDLLLDVHKYSLEHTALKRARHLTAKMHKMISK